MAIERNAASGPSIRAAELQRHLAAGTAVVVDVRDRDSFRHSHQAGAVNIPMEELDIRGAIERTAAKTIVVDCGQAEEHLCAFSEHILRDKKFLVAILRN